VDAVFIAIPDHSHACATMMAIKLGKHVYCEKPLTHDIYEARALGEAARQYKVMTQMGNQGHAGESIRVLRESAQLQLPRCLRVPGRGSYFSAVPKRAT
jgi:predicted dehydrogenase